MRQLPILQRNFPFRSKTVSLLLPYDFPDTDLRKRHHHHEKYQMDVIYELAEVPDVWSHMVMPRSKDDLQLSANYQLKACSLLRSAYL